MNKYFYYATLFLLILLVCIGFTAAHLWCRDLSGSIGFGLSTILSAILFIDNACKEKIK